MTTTAEQLPLNVLTAPLAAVDRRALSQAWYSALYRTGTKAAPQRAAGQMPAAPRAMPVRSILPEHAAAAHRAGAPLEKRTTGTRTQLPQPAERRMPRVPLAKKIERTLLSPGAPARSATFRIGKGRVHVVVRQCASGLQLVALCARGAHAGVAQALMQARFALAHRGIALETKLYEDGASL